MRIQRELTLGIVAIVTVQLVVSSMTIGLLARMGPAIERILEENVYSAEAVEDMLASLALESGDKGTRDRFENALQRAKNNVTEDEEQPVLGVIDAKKELMWAGDATAREDIVNALGSLGDVNRSSMIRADKKAQNLGLAGAWAAAILGALNLALGWLVQRRFRIRFGLPIDEIRHTLRQIRAGNVQARTSRQDAPHEIQEIVTDLNAIMDDSLFSRTAPTGSTQDLDLRIALNWLLDRSDFPVVLLDAKTEIVAKNRAALDLKFELGPSWRIEEIPNSGMRLALNETPKDQTL